MSQDEKMKESQNNFQKVKLNDLRGGWKMGFLSGPSKSEIVGMARGVVSFAMQLQILETMEKNHREKIIEGMKAEGAPTSINELTRIAAQVIRGKENGNLEEK